MEGFWKDKKGPQTKKENTSYVLFNFKNYVQNAEKN